MGKDDGGISAALKNKQGDCTEYSELMMAYCSALNIPSRFIEGKALQANSAVSFHNWVEIYFERAELYEG